MSNRESLSSRRNMIMTVLLTAGWLAAMVGWIAFAWGYYSGFQILAGLAIATLVFAGMAGYVWLAGVGRAVVTGMISTLGWLSFVVYWIAFAWRRYTLVQSFALLSVSFIVLAALNAVIWLSQSTEG
ncbi:MAG: hypothetical protein JSW37_04420 [Anaerolineales bacterium]|nr:MAG: hypothetical protein JSW37_04420 [Anaerolineales bacterium]